MASDMAAADFAGELGNGLVRRWSTAADVEKIGDCLATVFRPRADAPLNQGVVNEVQIMLSPGFPLMGSGDFALVEDTSLPERPVVACLCYFRHYWSVGGIPFGVGRPELVATRPGYRNKGLIRSLFEMLHARSAACGDLVQAITGIEHYYRQFGYEYVLDLGGNRTFAAADVAALPDGEVEPYILRPAALEDVPHLMALYEQSRKGSLVWHEMTEADWRYYITVWDEPVVQSQAPHQLGLAGRMHMIVDGNGEVCGFTWVAVRRRSPKLGVWAIELYQGRNWQAVMPSLLRAFCALGQQLPPMLPTMAPFREIVLALGRTHGAYEVLDEKLHARGEPIYAWYVRVEDVPQFLRHMTPLLEQRLADSILSGYSGELKFDFYPKGLRLRWEKGRMTAVEPWQQPDYDEEEADLGIPRLLFNQLLLGYRSLSELRAIFPDVTVNGAAALLIDILFPKQPSHVWVLGYT